MQRLVCKMAAMAILTLGYACLNACASSDYVPDISISNTATSLTASAMKPDAEQPNRRSVGNNNETTVKALGGSNVSVFINSGVETQFTSRFNFDPKEASGLEPVELSLNDTDPVENFKLSSFDPLKRAVTSLGLDREFNSEPVEAALSGKLKLNKDFDSNGQRFEVDVIPRFSLWKQDNSEGLRLGGELRIGQHFDQRGKGDTTKGWYFFVGTDDEALTLGSQNRGTLALVDQLTVGDLQAGLLIGGQIGQVILGVTRREVSYSDTNMSISHEEDIAGVSFVRRF